MNIRYCYFNGNIVDLNTVIISPNDLGFLRGYGVFDAMRTFKGKPFLLDQHWERLLNSAKELNIEVPISKEEFLNIIESLLKKNNFEDVSIKTVLTGGFSENGITMNGNPTILIVIDDISIFTPAKELFKKGAKVITLEFKRFLPKAKTLNYIAAIKEQEKKNEADAQEIIYINNETVLEGATSNIFIVKDNKIITADDNILMGTTRNFVIDLAKKNNFEIEERSVATEELFSADESFITGTYKWVLPITSVDGKKIGSGSVGMVTKKMMKLVSDFIEGK
jgi:branched-chain amino acid aminotransferase